MKELDADYQKENKRNLRKLILSIQSSFGKLNLLIAICDNRRYRDEVIQTYETELRAKGVRCDRIKVAQLQPSLKQSLETLVKKQSPAELDKLFMVTVLGASDLLDLRLNQEKSPLETFLFSVQWTREALRSFQFPIVLWVTQRIAAELAKQAPDFWSWRGGVFEFFQPSDAPSFSQDVIIPEIPDPREDVHRGVLQPRVLRRGSRGRRGHAEAARGGAEGRRAREAGGRRGGAIRRDAARTRIRRAECAARLPRPGG